MINAVLRLAFGGRWYVQFVLALLAFGAAGYCYDFARRDLAEMAVALEQGPPAPVSLNAFDPARDIHPAKEVTVTGWINPAYNYELTEERRKRSDIVRRMFVLFGPEDTSATKTVRAIVMMPPSDVDRFFSGPVMDYVGHVEGHPLLTLNGTAKTYATLDNMAEDAMKEQGLTKAPGFRYIEIWPAEGRAAALAPIPELPWAVAAIPGVPGLLLLLVAGIKFSRRNARGVLPDPAAVAADAQVMQDIRAADSAAFDRFAAAGSATASPAPAAPLEPGAAPLKGLLKAQVHSNPVYSVSALGTAEDRPDESVAQAAPQAPDMASVPESPPRTDAPGLAPAPAADPSVRTNPLNAVKSVGRAYTRFKQVAVACALLGLLYVGSERFGLNGLMAGMTPSLSTSVVEGTGSAPPSAETGPAKAEAPSTPVSLIPETASLRPKEGSGAGATAPTPLAVDAAVEPALSAPAPAPMQAEAAAEPIPAPMVEAAPAPTSQLTEATVPDVPVDPAPVEVAPVVAAPAAAPVEPAIPEPVATVAQEPAPQESAVQEPATITEAAATPAAETAELAAEPASPAPEPVTADTSLLAGLPLPGFGQMLLILPIVGAVLLALAAFALMRGRQSAPPAAFAGRDPWEKLAREARSGHGTPA